MEQIFNNIHDSVYIIGVWSVTPVCGSTSHIKSGGENLPVTQADHAQGFELFQLLIERSQVPHFFNHQHINERSRAHHWEKAIVRIKRPINFFKDRT